MWLSVLLHGLVLLALWLHRVPAVEPEPPPSSEVAVVFDNPSGPLPASTASLQPTPVPQASIGNPDAPVAPPAPDTTPPGTTAPAEPSTAEAAPPLVTASIEPTPQPPAPAPAPPPTVSFRSDELSFQLPPLTLPEPPPPLPPLPPRTVPPHPVTRPPNRPASPFGHPQDWSFNGSARPSAPGRASKGYDFGVKEGGSSEADMSYVAGAHPSGDWNSALRRWAQARIYYPEEAAANGQEGVSGVFVEIDRSGRVLSVKLEQSARSAFLDGAWVDVWRNSHVPPFTPDMTEPTTTIRFNLYYHLIRR